MATLPTEVFIYNMLNNHVIEVEKPTEREYTILTHLQGKQRLDYLPFSLVPTNGGEEDIFDFVFKEGSEEVRAIHLFQLLNEMVDDSECTTIETLSGAFNSDCPFEQAELEGMLKAVYLLGGFDAAINLHERMIKTKLKEIDSCTFIPTVFCDFDV